MGEAAPTVLVVDDDPEVLETTIAIVEGLGYQVVSARNGREALSIIRADHSIAILFTDITMPGGIDGWELGRQSRAARPDLRLIYTSGKRGTSLKTCPLGLQSGPNRPARDLSWTLPIPASNLPSDERTSANDSALTSGTRREHETPCPRPRCPHRPARRTSSR
jgi:CheY-like chemotaxis protein